jgi:transposase-like protein
VAIQRRWAPAVRARAVALRQDEGMLTAAIVEALRHEHGADVPPSTVEGWLLAERKSAPPVDVPLAVEEMTARLVTVLGRELSALERCRGRLDLARVERLTRSLSMLRRSPTRDAKSNGSGKGKTLIDLASDASIGDADV